MESVSNKDGWLFGSRQEAATGWKVCKESFKSVEELVIDRLAETVVAETKGLNTSSWTILISDA